ncbi:MAG: autotransporter outer membrane beta-barrel domain-containing protein [Deltaproteobacteria bacterium]|nr:autotransporter outer membrane beta-barrel domain-containing protein [Deltaproteobacteria bacterium]
MTDDGYLGRYSGRGLFDMELVGGVTTLLHGASVKVNSFTMMPNAVLLTTANLEKNLYPTITAKAFDFREHSHVGLDESFMFGGNNLPAGSEYTVLRLEHTGGSSLFVNDSTAFAELARDYRLDIPGIIPAPKGTVSVGAYDYPASIRWSDDRKTLLLKIEGAPAVNVEHSGMQAEESLRQVANIGGYMTSGNVFTHLVPNEAAYSHVLQAPRPVQPPHIRQAPGFMRPNGERSAPSSGEDGDRLWSLWVSPWYSYNRHETREGTIGYTVKAPGLTLGVERSLIDGSALVGVAVGAAMPEVDGDYISLEAHTVSATAYAAAILPFEVDLSAVVSYSVSRYDQDRVSEGSHYFAGYHGKGVSAAAMAGRRFQLSRQFAVRPYARMDYIHNDIEPYTELGQGPQARAMSRNSSDLWQSELGADLIFSAENGITFTGRLGWTRHFNDTLEFDGYYLSDQPSPSLFRVSSVQFDKNALVYGLDVKFPVAESVDIRFSYDGSVSTHDSSHTGALTGIFSF